jgi:hypothetical protein
MWLSAIPGYHRRCLCRCLVGAMAGRENIGQCEAKACGCICGALEAPLSKEAYVITTVVEEEVVFHDQVLCTGGHSALARWKQHTVLVGFNRDNQTFTHVRHEHWPRGNLIRSTSRFVCLQRDVGFRRVVGKVWPGACSNKDGTRDASLLASETQPCSNTAIARCSVFTTTQVHRLKGVAREEICVRYDFAHILQCRLSRHEMQC